MKILSALGLLLLLSLGVQAQPEGEEKMPKLSLYQAVCEATKSSALLRETQALQNEARASVQEALAPGRPQIKITAISQFVTPIPAVTLGGRQISLTDDLNYQVAASLRQSIFDFGRSHYRYRASLLGQEVAELRELETRRILALAVARSFFESLIAREMMNISADALEAQHELLRASEVKVKEGAAAKYDLFRSRTLLAEAQSEALKRESQYLKARALLWSLTGRPFEMEAPEISVLMNPEMVAAENLKSERPDLQLLRGQQKMSEQLVLSASVENKPTLSFQTQYLRQNPVGFQLDHQWSVGLQLEVPISDGGLTSARIEKAKARKAQVEAQITETERRIAVEVEQRQIQFELQQASLDPATRRLEEAQEAHRLSRLRYQVGLTDLSELLVTRSALTQAKIHLKESQYQLQLAWIEWAAADGSIFEHLETLHRKGASR